MDQRDHATALLPVVRRRWSKDPRSKKTERREATEPPTECGAGGKQKTGMRRRADEPADEVKDMEPAVEASLEDQPESQRRCSLKRSAKA